MTRSTTSSKKRIQTTVAVLFWLGVWQAASMWIGEDLFLVSPISVIQTLFSLVFTTDFWGAVSFSFLRIVGGFLLALLTGTALAVLAARFPFFRILLRPPMLFIKSTPVASFIILALIWISSRNLAVFISFLMVLPIVYTNTLEGILSTDVQLLEMARMFRIPPLKKMLYLYLPAVFPYFVSACTVGLGLCWKSGVAAEVIGLPDGSIGEQLYQAKIFLSTGELFAWTTVIILVSLCFEKLFLFLLRLAAKKIEKRSTRL
jgi:NitT/TauT family transport system permease protein